MRLLHLLRPCPSATALTAVLVVVGATSTASLAAPASAAAARPAVAGATGNAPQPTGIQPLLPPGSQLGMARIEKKRHPKTPPVPPKRVDINHASARELKTLPGIGDVEAERIIAGRPYWSKAELVSKKVLPAGPYQSVHRRIVASQQGIAPPKPPQASPASAARATKR